MLVSLLAGCGSSDESSPGLAGLAPPDVPLYAEATVRPEGDQADAVSSIVEKVAGSTEPIDQLTEKLDQAMASAGLTLTYEDDIAPWIGHQAAIFVRSFESASPSGIPDAAVEIQADDVDAARDFLDRSIGPALAEQQTYSGVDYYSVRSENLDIGVVSDAVVFASDAAFKLAVDTSQGESLADSSEYVDRVSSLPEDRLGLVFADPGPVIEAAAGAEPGSAPELKMIKPLFAGPLSTPVAAALSATDDSASIDIASGADGASDMPEESPSLADLPAGAWLAAAIPSLGPRLSRLVDELQMSGVPGAGQVEAELKRATGLDLNDDILAWLQGAAGYASGTSRRELELGLIANSDDPDAPRDLVDALRRLAAADEGPRPGLPPEGADYGFTVSNEKGDTFSLGAVGAQLVGTLRTSIDEALHPAASLADDDEYASARSALGDDFTPLVFTRLPSVFTVAELGGAGDDPDYEAARPYLDAFSYLIAGTHIDDGLAVSRVVVGLND
jgi:hypothetical protein